MGLHSPLSPHQKIFFSQWPAMDGRGFEPVGSLLNQPDSSSTSAQQYVAHEDVQIVPTALCPESKKEEEMTNCSVTREIGKLRGEGRSVLQNKSRFTESLRTPCFSDSLAAPSFLAAESPLCLSAGSLSPILLLSPLRKSSGVDLSMYLPENYTPATTEALESSFDGGMFQFPAVSSRESPSFEMDVDTQESERENIGTDVVGKVARTDVAPAGPSCQDAAKVEMDFGNSLGQTQIEFSQLFFDCSSRWTSTDSDDFNMEYESSDEDTDNATRNSFAMKSVEFPKRTKPFKADDRDKEISVSTRNKLERDRRRNMNSKLEKLRQIVPEVSKNKRASKVMILNKAAEYVKELSVTESTLFDRKAAEKARNETLVRKLVQLTSNM